jgi:hypothetical protein
MILMSNLVRILLQGLRKRFEEKGVRQWLKFTLKIRDYNYV